MKTILVTGGGGYIGVVLVEELLKRNYKVKVLDSFMFGTAPLSHLKNEITVIKGDIRTVSKKVLKGVDAVIHQAGLSNDPMADFDTKANRDINTTGTLRFATLCKEQGIKRFTFSSSASIYNRGILRRTRIQDENDIVKPKSAYSVSKYHAEQLLLKLTDKNFSPVIIRQGTVYGFSRRMRYDLVVNTMVKTALSEGIIYVFCGGVQWRPLVDVRDVALAHIKAIEAPEKKVAGQILNLAYENYQMLEVAHAVKRMVEKQTGKPIKISIDHTPKKDRSYRIDRNKLKKVLQWQPKRSIDESVDEMISYMTKKPWNDFKNPKYYNIAWFKLYLKKFDEKRKKK